METISKEDSVKISLLGRLAFPEEKLKEIITKSKRNPEAYIRGYNACDGKNTITEIAKIIGVTQSTLTPIFQDWETKGIIYEIESKIGKTYMKLYPLPSPKEKSNEIMKSEESINQPTKKLEENKSNEWWKIQ